MSIRIMSAGQCFLVYKHASFITFMRTTVIALLSFAIAYFSVNIILTWTSVI